MSDNDALVRAAFPVLGSQGAKVDWQFVADHGKQAQRNHYQTVERLAQRGGLSWCELAAVIENREYKNMDTNDAIVAVRSAEAEYLAALRSTPVTDEAERELPLFLVATVSEDTSEIGIDHPTEADWQVVLNAHIALRDRLNERIAEQGKCPLKPKPLDLPAQDEVEVVARAIHEHLSRRDIMQYLDNDEDCRGLATAAIAALDRHRAGDDALREENARLRGALRDASVSLWWAARQMKGNCNGSAVDAVNLAAENASSPASLTGRQG